MAYNVLELMEGTNPQKQEVQRLSNRLNKKKLTPRHTI